MNSPEVPWLSMADNAEDSDMFVEESRHQRRDRLLPLPVPGSQERLLAERKLLRKLDARLLPMIVIIYMMNYVDRNGITTARLQGMEQDLYITDVQYATVVAVFYASYSPAQIPSNMILNLVTRPSWYIGGCVVLWGLTSALTGIAKNFPGILACRLFIGLPEAAFYPGSIYLLSRWYTKKELAFRSAILYVGLLVSNAFGALIAAGILATMEGKWGIRAWRWLFFIEGSITIVVGFFSMWALPDYPDNTRWITDTDRQLAQARMSEDAGEADKDNAEDSPIAGLMMAIKDPIVLLFALMTMCQILGLSFSNFFPTLTQTLGYDTTVSLLLAAPPWVVAAVICCFNSWHADKTGERFFHIAVWWWGVILAFTIALSTMSIAGRYVSLFLMACGYVGISMNLVWVSNSVPRPPAKRAAAIGIVNGFGNIGNVIGSYAWKAVWGSKYHQSMVISLIAFVLSTAISLVIRQILILKNRRLDADEKAALEAADRARVAEAARLEGMTFERALERRKGYRYLY